MPRSMFTPFMTSVLTTVCFCALLEAAPARVAAQTTPVVAPKQTEDCHVVKKTGKGKPETTSCTSVFVTVPAPPTTTSAVDECKIGFQFSWLWLKCNATAVGAVASSTSAVIALVIGYLVFRLNRNIRRGQVAHEQMRMLLEIDDELIERPELWAVHGTTFLPAVEVDKLVGDFGTASTEKEKSEVALKIANVLSAAPKPEDIIKLRKLGFVSRYFNFFEMLFVNYGKKPFLRRHPEKFWESLEGFWNRHLEKYWGKLLPEWNEDWKAWRTYITVFFQSNEYARNQWTEFAKPGIYSESFTKFMTHIVEKARADAEKAARAAADAKLTSTPAP